MLCQNLFFILDFSIKRFDLWYTSGRFQMFFQQAPREWPQNIDFEKGQIGSDPKFYNEGAIKIIKANALTLLQLKQGTKNRNLEYHDGFIFLNNSL